MDMLYKYATTLVQFKEDFVYFVHWLPVVYEATFFLQRDASIGLIIYIAAVQGVGRATLHMQSS